jgi:hypothetical protein
LHRIEVQAVDAAGHLLARDTLSFRSVRNICPLLVTATGGAGTTLVSSKLHMARLDGSLPSSHSLPLADPLEVPQGDWHLQVEAAGRTPWDTLVTLSSGALRTIVASLPTPARQLRLAVRTLEGEPYAGATALLEATHGSWSLTALSDKDGEVVLAPPAGQAHLRLLIPGAPALLDTLVDVDGNLDLGFRTALPSGRWIRGTVTSDQGLPLAGIALEAWDPQGSVRSLAWSDAEGNYLLAAAGNPIHLQIATPGWAPQSQLLHPDPQIWHPFRLSQAGGLLQGRLLHRTWITTDSSETLPLSHHSLRASTPAGNTLFATSDAQGRFQLPSPNSAPFTQIETCLPSGSNCQAFQDLPQGVVTRDLALESRGRVEGSLTLPIGTAPSEVRLQLSDSTTGRPVAQGLVLSLPTGLAWRFDDIPEGTWRVDAATNSTAAAPVHVQVRKNMAQGRYFLTTGGELDLTGSPGTIQFALSEGGTARAGKALRRFPLPALGEADSLWNGPATRWQVDLMPTDPALVPRVDLAPEVLAGDTVLQTTELPLRMTCPGAILQGYPNGSLAIDVDTRQMMDSLRLHYRWDNGDWRTATPQATELTYTRFGLTIPHHALPTLQWWTEGWLGTGRWSSEHPSRQCWTTVQPNSSALQLGTLLGDTLHLIRGSDALVPLSAMSSTGAHPLASSEVTWTLSGAGFQLLPAEQGAARLRIARSAGPGSLQAVAGSDTLLFQLVAHTAVARRLGLVAAPSRLPILSGDTVALLTFAEDTLQPDLPPFLLDQPLEVMPSLAARAHGAGMIINPIFLGQLRLVIGAPGLLDTSRLEVEALVNPGSLGREYSLDTLATLRIPDSAFGGSWPVRLQVQQPDMGMANRADGWYAASGPWGWSSSAPASQLKPLGFAFSSGSGSRSGGGSGSPISRLTRLLLAPASTLLAPNAAPPLLDSLWNPSADDSLVLDSLPAYPWLAWLLARDSTTDDFWIHALPNPFSPEVIALRDGNDQPGSRIEFQLPTQLGREALVTLTLFNMAGERVRTLAERAPMAPGIHQLYWDGRADSGRWARNGRYVLACQVHLPNRHQPIIQRLLPVVVFK